MIINQSGITLRLPVASIRIMGRATQGVKLIDLGKRGDTIASVCKVDSDPETEIEEESEETISGTSSEIIENEINDNAVAEENSTDVENEI